VEEDQHVDWHRFDANPDHDPDLDWYHNGNSDPDWHHNDADPEHRLCHSNDLISA
jgi:hypothetical protein